MRRQAMVPIGWVVAFLMIAGSLAPLASAQDATPAASPVASPVTGTGETITSITREQYYEQLFAAFPMEEPAQEGGSLILSQSSDIKTVNAMLAADSPTFYVTNYIFEAMVGTSPIDGQPVPSLADGWEIAPDGVTYTFHLSKEAKWHDGTDFTADDVKFSVDAILNPETGSSYTSGIESVLESYRVIDADTFEAVSKGQIATFLIEFGIYVPIIPKHLWESLPPADWATDSGSTGQDPSRVVGTGPFKFQEWVQGDHVTLVRNDDYYDPNAIPHIDEYTLRILPNPETELQALLAGEVDVLETIPAPDTEDVQNTEGLKVDIYDNFGFSYLGFNLDPAKTTLFQDKAVREALFVAIDREAIRESIYLGYGEVGLGTQPKLSIAYAPERLSTTYAYDVERAKQLLADAGWTDTNGDGTVDKDGQEMSFEFLTAEGGGVIEQVMVFIQDSWKAIGVNAEPIYQSFPTFLELTGERREFDIFWGGFNWDVTANQGLMFECASYDGGFNDMKYCNPQYDALNEQALHELDPEARKELQIEASSIVWDDLPVLILRFGVSRTGYSDRLHNYYPNGYSYIWSLPFVWLEE